MKLIDADAAIESLTEYGNGRAVYIGVEEAVRRIEQLPSAQPERKKGKWVYDNGLKQFFCDQCGEPSLTYDDIYIYSMDFPNFCPECGADMRGKTE